MGNVSRVERKTKRKRFGIIFFLLLFVIGLFLFISLKTDFFKISKVAITGNNKTPREKILKAAGNIENENIFKLNIKTVKEKIESIPNIREVEIKRRLPNSIVIAIQEREIKMKMSYVGSVIYFDEEGYILSIGEQKSKKSYTQLIGLKISKPEIGDNLFEANNDFKKLNDFINLSESINILKEFDKIDIKKKENLVIQLRTGTKVSFGDLDNLKYKLSFLDNIIKDMKKKEENYKYIYLNKGENPIIVTESD